MKKERSHTRGFSPVEILLSAAVFSLLVTAFVGAFLYGEEATTLSGERNRAALFASEGLEAVRNIRDGDFADIVDGSYGLAESGGEWTLSPDTDSFDIYTRSIEIASDGQYKKQITSTVVWQQNPQRTGSVTLQSVLTDWRRSSATSTP